MMDRFVSQVLGLSLSASVGCSGRRSDWQLRRKLRLQQKLLGWWVCFLAVLFLIKPSSHSYFRDHHDRADVSLALAWPGGCNVKQEELERLAPWMWVMSSFLPEDCIYQAAAGRQLSRAFEARVLRAIIDRVASFLTLQEVLTLAASSRTNTCVGIHSGCVL
jgi:hypothetical protein